MIKGGNREPAYAPRSAADDAARDLRRLLVCLLVDDSGYKAADVAVLAGISMAQVRADLRIGRAIRAKALRWR